MNKIFVDFEWHPTDETLKKPRYEQIYEIIQFGAVKLDDNNQQIDTFNVLVKPRKVSHITYRYEELTHICDDDLADKDDFVKVLYQFIDWCKKPSGDYCIYSWSDSDYNQICDEMDDKEIEDSDDVFYMVDHWYDFQQEFDQMIGFVKRQNLEDSLKLFEIASEGMAHDALIDAINTSKLYALINNPESSQAAIEKIKNAFAPKQESKNTLGALFDLSKLVDEKE